MKIENLKYLILSFILLLFLIGAANATDDFSDTVVNGDASAVDSVIENIDSPAINTVNEDDSTQVTDDKGDIQDNANIQLDNYDVEQEDSSSNEIAAISNEEMQETTPYWFIEGGEGYETLADAVAATEDGDVIYGLPGTYTVNGIQVLHEITIKANETESIVLNGNGSQMFIANATLNLINLTLANGGSSGGGFVSANNCTLSLINSTLRDLRSSGAGGAIILSESNLNIEGSRFENINSSANAPILKATDSNSLISIKDSSFNDINCSKDYTLMQIAGNLTLERTNLTNIIGKYASQWYGAIGLISYANAFINECQFINITGGDGSSIYFNSKGNLTVIKSVFMNNKNVRGSIFLNNNQACANINYNLFIDNEAPSSSAARDVYVSLAKNVNADYNFWGANSQPTTSQITRVSYVDYWTIVNLYRFDDIVYMGTTADISLEFLGTNGEKTCILDEYMPEYAFDLSATDGTIDPAAAIIKNNVATLTYTPPSSGGTVTITATPGPAELLIDIRDPSELLVVSTEGSNSNPGTLESPYATIAYALSQVTETRNVIYLLNKGEVYEEYGLIISGNVTIRGEDDSIIIKGGNAGRIFLVTGNASIKDLILTGGKADDYGGAIYVDGGSLILDNVIISKSNASHGGAIYINTTYDVSISSSFLADNLANNGDGIYIENGNVTLSGNDMDGETIYLAGGSINSKLVFLANSTVNAEIGKTFTLTASLTDDKGNIIKGGIVTFTANGETIGTVDLNGDNELSLDYTVPEDASGNIVISGSYSFDNAGTVATGTLHPCEFIWIIEDGEGYETLAEAIDAAQDGDVIYGLPGTYTIRNLAVNKNITIKANESGSIILDGNGTRIFTISSEVNLINLTLSNGASDMNGGLIYTISGKLSLNNTALKDTIMAQDSLTRGGAVYSCGSLYIYNCVFENLKAEQGAAIYEDSINGILIIDNSIFNNINSTYDGGLITSKVGTSISRSNFTNIIGINTTNEYGNIRVSGGNLTITESNFINISGPSGAAVYYTAYNGVLNITKSVFENVNCTNRGIIYSISESYINYNIFLDVNEGVNTSLEDLGNGNIDYNYWGTNEDPSSIMPTYSPDKWIIMNAVLNESGKIGGNDVKITVDFNHYMENGEIKELEEHLTKEFTVSFSSPTGEFDVNEANTTDQVAIAIYTPAMGENNISIKSSNCELDFTIVKPLKDHMYIKMDDEEKLIVTIEDEDGNGLEGKTIELTIDNKTLSGTTDAEGKAVISLEELEDGAYNATISFMDPIYENIEMNTFIIIKSKEIPIPNRTATKIKYSNMTTTSVHPADGRIGEYFKITLVDENGKALANKSVQIGFNGKVYNRTTDKNGNAQLQINLARADIYTFAIAFLGDDNYTGSFEVAVITVNAQTPKLTTPAKKYKANAKTKTLTATLKTAHGNPVKGKAISFTINGKTYKGTTNANGVVRVNVSLSKKGTYICTAKYAGDTSLKATIKKFNVKIV